ncbi:hypothetical protein [Streptomyces sp. NPDC002250]|uniref:hypothetical protein n=1 Tax=Streptomyces sp. NPDC002250 TaxID=3364641 RepID=UPI00368D8895
MTALAGALKLPVGELLELQRVAAGGGNGERPGPGRPIGQWDPHALEVHPAGIAQDGPALLGQRLLPAYVRREHDRILAEVVRQAQRGRSQMVVLVGESSTGKTRACWEAVQPLADSGWKLWHPFDPTRAKAALEDLHRVGPRTVVWLNEAQHYLGDRSVGEEIAAAVHHLLTDPQRGPILVLGTLWPGYAKEYTAPPTPGGADPHSRVRELLAGRIVSIPDSFHLGALATARALADAGDRLLAGALTRVEADGRLAQDLAGGPALLERYQTGSPAARALLEAAMDARRLGVGLHLPQAFLTDAAPDYLHDSDWNQLTDDWAEKAYAELAEQVHGKHAPLSRIAARLQRRPQGPSARDDASSPHPQAPAFRLADYLEQHGRTARRHLCPPASFWHAAHTHLTNPDDLDNLAEAAKRRHRLQWASYLGVRAAVHGSTQGLAGRARMRERAGDREGAEALARQAADRGNTHVLTALAEMREEAGDRVGAEALARRAADRGNTHVLTALARMREKARDRVGAEVLYRQAADRGDTYALRALAGMRSWVGDREGAEVLYRQAADRGDPHALTALAGMRERAGDREGAEVLYRQAADRGNTHALTALAGMRERAGDREGAEVLYRQAADRGNTHALTALAEMRERAGDREGAESVARQAADHGDTRVLTALAEMREKAGDREGAESVARQAADHGDTHALAVLARKREVTGDREGAETLAHQAADHGDSLALAVLAHLREKAGDREGAETLYRRASEPIYRQASDDRNTFALIVLAHMRERMGDREGAETLARQAANRGSGLLIPPGPVEVLYRLWPFGLDPDGTPTLHRR